MAGRQRVLLPATSLRTLNDATTAATTAAVGRESISVDRGKTLHPLNVTATRTGCKRSTFTLLATPLL